MRKLKVCIELKGLRLSKPAADIPQIKQERSWPPQPRPVAPALCPRERKFRPGEPDDRAAAAQRTEINRKWGCEKLPNGKSEWQVAPLLSSAGVTEVSLWLAFHFLVEQPVFRGFPESCRGGGGVQRK